MRRALFRLTAIAFAAATFLFAAPAQAGFDFASAPGDCRTKIQRGGLGESALRLPMGTVDVEFWGNGLDLGNVNLTHGVAGMSAEARQRHTGVQNAARGCGLVGSTVVRFVFPSSTESSQLLLTFDLGGAMKTTIALVVRPYPQPGSLTWDDHQDARCLGDVQVVDNFKTVIIQLPPGHAADRSNCAATLTLNAVATVDRVDLQSGFSQHFTGLPRFATANAVSLKTTYAERNDVSFDLDSTAVRALTSPSISTITVAAPNGLSSNTVRLEIRPNVFHVPGRH